jgi:light-regulated signal transduction histidine kinase (bacteriophytochrome)
VVFPREESGSGIVLMTMTDITERVNALEDLQRSRLKLLEANRELESFSYTVSHDLRAPLRSVIGYSHMLREDYGERLDEEGLRLCRIIDSSAVKMGRLIDDLLEFSRFGRSELHNEMIHMETLASRVFFEITTPEERTRIRFIVQELPRIMGDLMMIKQVWVNLISNAIKYSSKQSKATITIGAKNGDKENIYYVSDNGIGFDIQYADKLFGVFQRLHSTKEFEGTGVGLAIVQRILERHGGRVYADGKVGEGATFYFAMPKTDNLP